MGGQLRLHPASPQACGAGGAGAAGCPAVAPGRCGWLAPGAELYPAGGARPRAPARRGRMVGCWTVGGAEMGGAWAVVGVKVWSGLGCQGVYRWWRTEPLVRGRACRAPAPWPHPPIPGQVSLLVLSSALEAAPEALAPHCLALLRLCHRVLAQPSSPGALHYCLRALAAMAPSLGSDHLVSAPPHLRGAGHPPHSHPPGPGGPAVPSPGKLPPLPLPPPRNGILGSALSFSRRQHLPALHLCTPIAPLGAMIPW